MCQTQIGLDKTTTFHSLQSKLQSKQNTQLNQFGLLRVR